MMYPIGDNQFKEHKIAKVEPGGDGCILTLDGGLLMYVDGNDCPAVPHEGDTARCYSSGIGSQVRGLFVNGIEFFYRTEEQQKEHREIQLYGKDVAEWVSRWDAGQTVWSVEMGGLGPGYEQCIQITVAELLRFMLGKQYDHATWADQEVWDKVRKEIRSASYENETVMNLGLSGAQFGAAMSLSTNLFMRGPRSVMMDPQVKDRRIQVSKNFPGVI